jgi:Mn2+/Fe2+ NRAMP family transporter
MSNTSPSQRWRFVLFGMGWTAAVASVAACVCSWSVHFPLLSDGQGGWRLNPLEDWVLIAGLSTSLVAIILGSFGKGVGRVFLIAMGILFILLNMAAWMSNHR